MMSKPTDHANVNLAELHRAVIRGKSRGMIIWQPRIGCWMADKQFAGIPLPPPFTNMTYIQVYRELKCSARIYDFNQCYRLVRDSRISMHTKSISATDEETIIETPVGKQISIARKTPNSPRTIRIKGIIESEDEFKVATWVADHSTWEWDQGLYEKKCMEWGPLGLPTMYMPRINIQDLFINSTGVEKTIYALGDWQNTVETYFRALNEFHGRLIDVINSSPVEVVNFGDNVHSATLSPNLFKKYVLPEYQLRCERLHSAGKFVHAHWDGNVKPLLPYARETGLDGIEAITPEPQGDVTIEEVKEALGDDMFFIDGLPAILFDEIFPISMLEEYTHKIIKLFAPKSILGISDEISSTGDIERIRIVGKIVDDYNARVTQGICPL